MECRGEQSICKLKKLIPHLQIIRKMIIYREIVAAWEKEKY